MTAQPWDKKQALEQIGGDPELLAELIALFLDDSDNQMGHIRSAIEGNEARQLEQSAHAFKGSVVNFAANHTRDLALALEMMGRSGDLSGAAPVFDQLEEEYGRLVASMRA